MKVTAIQVFIDHGHDICPPESILGRVHVIASQFQFFKVIFNTFAVCTCPGIRGLNIKIMCAVWSMPEPAILENAYWHLVLTLGRAHVSV